MRTTRFSAFASIVFGTVLVTSGCATKSSRLDPLVQCETQRAQCEQQRQQCADNSRKLSTQLSGQIEKRKLLEKELADARQQAADTGQALAECRDQSTKVEQRAKSLEAAKAELDKRLTKSIAQRDVQIELLNNKLSVRVLNRILFDSGSATIQKRGMRVLGEVASVLASGNELIRVEGHTDNVPISAALKYRYQTNWELSAARAISVVRLFQNEHEIEPARMEAVGHSFYQPVTSNETEVERQFNRRVEVILTAPER